MKLREHRAAPAPTLLLHLVSRPGTLLPEPALDHSWYRGDDRYGWSYLAYPAIERISHQTEATSHFFIRDGAYAICSGMIIAWP